jgi:acyl-CoA reductase-like NAD-dependent aldehyde dehydrogenase
MVSMILNRTCIEYYPRHGMLRRPNDWLEGKIVTARMSATNPATLERLQEVEETPVAAVTDLYRTARTEFAQWSKTSVEARLVRFKKLRLHLVQNLDAVSQQISDSTGKPQVEALTTEVLPVLEAISHVEKSLADSLRPQKVRTPLLLKGKASFVEYHPRGVVLIIAPWNFPFQLTVIPVLNALAAGNTVILKPSEITPLIGTVIESVFAAAEFPQHVLQVAHGGRELGSSLVEGHPDYIFFTGSVQTGQSIAAVAARELIPTTLELGGKDPMIVFADAPLERAVEAALWGGFMNSGQVCMSVERIYVERAAYERFVETLSARTQQLVQGRGPDADIGSMTSRSQVEVVSRHVRDALEHHAQLETGQSPDAWNLENGYFIPPMVVTGARADGPLLQDETFGPVLPILPFDTEEEAICLANDCLYGLSASVWSKNLGKARRVASQLVTGNVLINDVVITIVNQHLPFGGEKSSGLGRSHGADGIRMFCRQTAVMVDRGVNLREPTWFPYRGKYVLFRQLIRSYYGERRNWFAFLQAYRQLTKRSRDEA